MPPYKAQFAEFLSRRGLKLTRQRKRILEEVFSSHDHFKAEKLLQDMSGISRATLYRTLALLVEAKLLRQETFGERHAHYEHVLGHGHHDHLVCLECGEIVEFRNDEIEKRQEEVCRRHKFSPVSHRMSIYGYCAKCTEKQRRENTSPQRTRRSAEEL